MGRASFILWFLMILLAGGAGAFGETVFVYMEEELSTDGEYDRPVREGLLSGLFERDHIVFDDAALEGGVDWKVRGFKPLIDRAADGGARVLVAVRVTFQLTPLDGDLRRISGSAHFYCYEVQKERLLGEGTVESDNRGRERELSRQMVSALLGEELSAEIDRICTPR